MDPLNIKPTSNDKIITDIVYSCRVKNYNNYKFDNPKDVCIHLNIDVKIFLLLNVY